MTNIRLATNEDKHAWDNFVYCNPKATPYQLFGWREAVEIAYGHRPHYLIAEIQSRIAGILPLFIFRIPFVSKSLISLPFCDVGDVLAVDIQVQRRLVEKAIEMIKEKQVEDLEMRCCREQLIEETDNGFGNCGHPDKVRMLMDLPEKSEQLWKSFKSKLRSQVRKSEKNGLTFEWGSLDKIDDFYSVFSRNMRDLGSPVHSKRWVCEILNQYGDNARMGLVYSKNKPIGCGIIICTKYTVSIPWASTLRESNHLAPNMILYWNLIKFASDSGRKQFDFGRSTLNEGTFRFKKQWGATPTQLHWYKKQTCTENTDPNKSREGFVKIWQNMPLSVANLLGPNIRKYISL